MLDDTSLRLIGVGVATVLLGARSQSRARTRLREWQSDPVAARARAVKMYTVLTTGVAYLTSFIVCAGVVLFVELFVELLRGIW